jgi:hypothetical protein
MPSSDFVNSCISQPANKLKSNYIYFPFGLEVGNKLSSFNVYRDLNGVENATKNHLLSLNPLNQIVDINRLSNDTYYNFVLNVFEIPLDKEIRCFIWKRWRDDYRTHDKLYFFCFDDFPTKNKGFVTLSSKSYNSFIDRFFNGRSWFANKYQTGTYDFYQLDIYTAIFGSSPTCTSFNAKSTSYTSNNRGCLGLPISVSYSIHNYADPEDEFVYSNNFIDSHIITSIMYYLSLDYFDNGVCCLAEIFGITE